MSKYLNAIRLLAKHNALDANSAEVLMNAHEEDGGPGSGNHGHAGRPGQRGGSAPGGGGGGGSKSGGGKRADYSSGGYEAMHSAGKPTLTAKGPASKKYKIKKSPNGFPIIPIYPNVHEPWGSKKQRAWEQKEAEKRGFSSYKEMESHIRELQQGWVREQKQMHKDDPDYRPPKYESGQENIAWRNYENSEEFKELYPRTYSEPYRYKGPETKREHGENWVDPERPVQATPEEIKMWKEKSKNYKGWSKEKEDALRKRLEEEKRKDEEEEEMLKKIPPSQRRFPDEPTPPFQWPLGESKDPTGRVDRGLASFRKDKLFNENMKQADKCFEAANDPEIQKEPKIQEVYKKYEDILSRPLDGKPSEKESRELREKKLAKVSGQLQPYFRQVYEKRLNDEPKITADLCDIADAIGTGMYGLGYRIKSADEDEKGECRSAEKIAEDMKEKGWTYEEAVDNFSDMVRYTQACTVDNLVDNFEKTKAALEKKGYKFAKVKNTWETFNEKKPYRGVNCVVVSPDGTRFELQFHTPESLVGKEVQHPWYEEFRAEKTSPERKKELAKKMIENMSKMTPPKNIGRISDYPPAGYD